jgi:hypothetical protein
MNTGLWIVVIVAVLVVVALIAWWSAQRQRSTHLRERFGPEYDRTVRDVGDARRAEPLPAERERRVQRFNIRPLTPDEQTRFADAWRAAQAHFVDDPAAAISEADALVTDVMRRRGYPVGDFEQQAADLSVYHATVVEVYRAAHAIAQRNDEGNASTEDLRQAMVYYRSLFADLLDVREPERMEVKS